jgi:hypothetical protein
VHHGALLSLDDCGSSVERTAKLYPLWRERSACLDQGSCSGRGRSTVGVLHLCWLEVGVTSDYFPVHASRSVIEALIRTAGRLAPSRACASGVLESPPTRLAPADGDPVLLHGFPYDPHS